ncbi:MULTISPECIES: sensor histidine kinase [unclassified Aureispira]|uniref:sensor histidine kinase n=1 Tax=unclassified Aureispira TaxID=2649989 RepID=UPI0007C8218B|nr:MULTISPECIES: histidine kinase [unclassified Aureispira]WMX12027.1 histidine kinase [Aureispira sp. CCB-E]
MLNGVKKGQKYSFKEGKKIVVVHIFLWCCVLFFFTQFFKFQTEDFTKIINFSLLLMPVTITTTYATIYHLIPKYLLRKHYWTFLIYSIYLITISACLIALSILGGLVFLSDLNVDEMLPMSKNFMLVFIGVYTIVFIASAFSLERQNQHTITKNQELKNQLLERELKLNAQKLNYLKMQIHPHFLFNTLNTIYGFALQKSDYTAEMILRLSNLLDYLLYQINDAVVELREEVEHIQDYIALEKLRFQDVLNINFEISMNERPTLVAPMLMLPFVENAFKHGAIKNGVFDITIKLQVKGEQIYFAISNSISSDFEDSQVGGIGLKNIRNRLDLLYKDRHLLNFDVNDDCFKVELYLNNDTNEERNYLRKMDFSKFKMDIVF